MNIEDVSNYEGAVSYLLGIPKFKKKTDPETTREFYEFLGCPCENKKIIHVAGTNGKGSTCAYMADMLCKMGKEVGLFTSPHLISVNERFRINGEMIPEDEFMDSFYVCLNAVYDFNSVRNIPQDSEKWFHPSFFEFLFFIAMVWFDFREIEYVVLETGLGGRLDATNVILKPMMTVIAAVSMDHTEQLGNTIEAIAKEKAGIIKDGCPVCYLDSKDVVAKIMHNTARKHEAVEILSKIYEDEDVTVGSNSIEFEFDSNNDICDNEKPTKVTLATRAVYQATNAALALNAMHYLFPEVTVTELAGMIRETVWVGRFQEIKDNLYVDGAHNEDGLRRLVQSVKAGHLSGCNLIFGVCRDKDYKSMLKILAESGCFKKVIFIKVSSPRSAEPKELADIYEGFYDCDGQSYVAESIDNALALCKEDGVATFIAGSLYLVGEAMSLYSEDLLK